MQIKWKALPIECFKLNVDGVIFLELQKAGVGAIVRDHAGKVILAASILEENGANAKSIKAIAIPRGLQICIHQGISKLIIESDGFVAIEISFGGDSNLVLGM